MAANAGDRIIVESEKVGKSPREGEIIKVMRPGAEAADSGQRR
jgi:Domain of unknown function (DUF1918)